MDQNIAVYHLSIRMKKWWWPLFAFMPNLFVNNAWFLYRCCPSYENDQLNLLGFTRRLVTSYLLKYSVKQRSLTPSFMVCDEVQLDRDNQVIVSIPKQRQYKQCGMKVSRACQKCQVLLHVDCFVPYHTK